MDDEITGLEQLARLLEPDGAQRRVLLEHVLQYAEEFLEGIPASPAYISRQPLGGGLYDSPISEDGMAIEDLIGLLREQVNQEGINPTSGRFLGYIPGGGLFQSALGDYLSDITNRFAGVFFASPGAVRMENMLLRWMAGVVGYPRTAAGNLASGGSIANLSAIVTAREAHQIEGERTQKAVVYLTEHTHHCIDKALRIAGLGRCVKRRIAVDPSYRMNPEALNEALESDVRAGLLPWLVVGSAGTTNTGAVDPLPQIASVAREHDVWFHIDGAYGALFALCPEGRQVLQGMQLSDSIVMDPHKTLFLPYGTGAVLVKDGRAMVAAHGGEADYMQDAHVEQGELSPADVSPELTKHFRGLRMWLPLKLAGVAPFRAALSEKILLARYFYRRIQDSRGFEVGPYPDLSIVIYRYLPRRGDAEAFNQRLIQEILNDGRIFISSTRVDGRFVLRMAISSFRTHKADIDEALDIITRKARLLEESS